MHLQIGFVEGPFAVSPRHFSTAWGACARPLVILLVVVLTMLVSGRPLYAQAPVGCGQLVHPVAGPAVAPLLSATANVVTVGDLLYFIGGSAGTTPTTQQYLWRTDGSPTGTFTVTSTIADFTPNYLLTALNGKLLLRAATPATGAELWISDGTAVGTHPLKEMAPGAAGVTYAGWFTFGGRFHFAVYEEDKATWWRTDGTVTNTVPLAQLYPAPAPVNTQLLAQSATELYVTAHLSDKEVELWRFDRQGFHKVKRFTGTSASRAATVIGHASLQNGKLYFFASVAGGSSGLWRSDGTTAGTTLLVAKAFALQSETATDGGFYAHTLLAYGAGRLFFFEADPPLLRLWRLDSPGEVLTLVKTMRARTEEGVYYDIQYDTAITYDQRLYFSLWWRDSRRAAIHTELWQSDGAAAGTRLFATLPVATRLSFGAPQGLFLLGAAHILAIPWSQPYPTVICKLGSPLLLSPKLFYQPRQIYITGRRAGMDQDYLWRLDAAMVQPLNVFLPLIGK